MNDESGTHKYKLDDAGIPSERETGTGDGFTKDEIDSLANLISDGAESDSDIDLDDTGRFTR